MSEHPRIPVEFDVAIGEHVRMSLAVEVHLISADPVTFPEHVHDLGAAFARMVDTYLETMG